MERTVTETEAVASVMAAAQTAATAMANWAQTVAVWQQASGTARQKRDEALQEIASQIENKMHQVNNKIQEMEKLTEEKRIEGLVQKYLQSEKKKLCNAAVQTRSPLLATPSAEGAVADQKGTVGTLQKPAEMLSCSNGAKRAWSSSPDSELHSSTPSKHQRTAQGDVTPTAPFPDSATQPFNSFASSLPSTSSPTLLNSHQKCLLSAVKSGRINDVRNYIGPPMNVDPNFRDKGGNTLLHVAVKKARENILNVLLGQGRMCVDAQDLAGQTALHVAAKLPEEGSCVNALLIYKADVNKPNANGDTPLHCAARNGHESIVKELLQNNASVTIVNNNGETPFDVAKTDGVRHVLQSPNLASLPANEHRDPS